MNTQKIVASFFILSAVIFANYIFIAIIGIIANAFNAGDAFFSNVYPFIIFASLTVSTLYAYYSFGRKQEAKTINFSGEKKNHGLRQSA